MSPNRVLVVDDAPEVLHIHVGFLRDAGMETSTAENGSVALDEARRILPDVIVTDVNMPVMDGLDLCRRLRADSAIQHVVVVVVTGGGAERDALAAGCDAVLGKPCTRTSLVGTIQSLLDRRQGAPAAH